MGSDKGANIKYLEAGTKVIPHDQLNSYMLSAMMNSNSTQYREPNQRDTTGPMVNAINWQTGQLTNAIKKNRPNININNRIDLGHAQWINEQVKN